jgi:hypothetical protein
MKVGTENAGGPAISNRHTHRERQCVGEFSTV